jgi:DoxX-like family
MVGTTDTKLRTVAYWSSTALSAGLFAAPGAALLARAPHFVHDMAHLGYPDYVLPLLGVWKILGAAVIVAPRLARLKEWAYAGMVFDATGAAISRAVLGDGLFAVAFPLAIAGVVLASWALRPAGRTLGAL